MFDSEKTILYLKSKSLEVYWKDKADVEVLDLTEFVSNLTVADKEKLGISLQEFLERIYLKNQSSPLILSKQVVFEKTIILNDPDQKATEIEKFLNEISFPKETVVLREIERGNILSLVAASRTFFEDIKEVLEKAGLKISLVTAVSLIEGVGDRESLSPAEVIYILDRLDSFKDIDFSQEAFQESKPSVETTLVKPKTSGLPFLLLAPLLIIGGFLLAALMLGLIKNPLAPEEIEPLSKSELLKEKEASSSKSIVEISSEDLEATSSAIVADYPSKEELKIKVVNGTGIAGQAGKVKDQLDGKGFKNIETDNASSYLSQPAKISYSSKVSPEVKEEIETELKQTFESLTTDTNSPKDFDILIITGK